MPNFRYDAYTSAGVNERGTLAADTEAHARSQLKEQNLLVVSLEAAGASAKDGRRSFSRKSKVKQADVAWMARQLATAQSAGLPIFRALAMLGRQREGTGIGRVMENIHDEMANGRQLSRAFADHEKELGPITTALVAAGESSGTLDKSLGKLADISESRVRLRRKIRSAMSYPAVMALLIVVMFLVMMLFVAPTFEGLYEQLEGELPAPTKLLIGLSGIVRSLWFLIPLIPVGLVVAYRQMKQRPVWRRRWEATLLRLPLFGRLFQQTVVARLAATLSSALAAGVPLLDSMDLAAQVANNSLYTEALEGAKNAVRDGRSLHASLGTSPVMPELMVRLVEVGEDTGSLPDLLDRYAKSAEEEVETTVEGLTSIIEPVLIVVLGLTIGGMLVSLYLPMFNVINLLQ